MSESFISVDGLHKHYNVRRGLFDRGRALHAVAGVSFEVEQGGTFGLVGESGSGKSTIAKVLLAAEPASAGSVRIGEHALGECVEPWMCLRRDIDEIGLEVAVIDDRQHVARIVVEKKATEILDSADAALPIGRFSLELRQSFAEELGSAGRDVTDNSQLAPPSDTLSGAVRLLGDGLCHLHAFFQWRDVFSHDCSPFSGLDS